MAFFVLFLQQITVSLIFFVGNNLKIKKYGNNNCYYIGNCHNFFYKANKHHKKCAPVQKMFSALTKEQKYSILNLLSLFKEFSNGNHRMNVAIFKIINFMRYSLGVTFSQSDKYFKVFGMEDLMKQLSTINDNAILDTVLYECYGILMLVPGDREKDLGFELLRRIFDELGYTQDDIINTIEKVNRLSQFFNK